MTELGTAHATASSGMNWKKYAEKYGKTYTAPKSGVVEADRRAAQIIKENAGKKQKAWVREVLGKKTVFSPENLDKWAGVGQKESLNELNDFYRNLELESANNVIDDVVPNSKIFPHADGNIYGQMLKDNIQPENIVKNKINWKAIGKWGAIAAGAVGIVGLGVLIGKKLKENQEVEQNNIQQPVATPVAVTEPDTIPAPAVPDVPAVEPAPVHNPNSVVDADGNITAKKGDGLWHIAKKYLEEKYSNEPEKYGNLPKAEQDKLIWKEVHRIAKLNNYELVTTVINGKEVIVTSPMIHIGDKVKVVETTDLAA